MLAELGDLRRDHRHAIRLEGIVGEVFLVVILSHIELVELCHLGDDGLVPNVLLVQLLDELLCGGLLFVIVIKDGGTVLCAGIGSLAVERGGVVDPKEYVQDVLVGYDLRVELDLYGFCMPGPSGADVAVAGGNGLFLRNSRTRPILRLSLHQKQLRDTRSIPRPGSRFEDSCP